MHRGVLLSCGLAAAAAAADVVPRQQTTEAPTTTTAAGVDVTAVTDCHLHGSELFCVAGATEYYVLTTITGTATSDVPAEFTGCHSHDSELYCMDEAGDDVALEVEGTTSEEEEHDHDHDSATEEEEHSHEEEEAESSSEDQHCHFHAGVEHCTGSDESESESASSCDSPSRDYNIGLRVGLLFVILATSALGVFGPILLHKVMPTKLNLLFTVLKQFGTGIIVSTAFIHLYTHAALMFGNECLGELEYEGTTAAILMAGLFISFLVEYIGQRIVLAKTRASAHLSPEEKAQAFLSAEVVSILVMEAGIIFHSLLIGLTLVVAGDEFFTTLFIVILFHQMFEGIALGTRIATIGTGADPHVQTIEPTVSNNSAVNDNKTSSSSPAETTPEPTIAEPSIVQPVGLSMKKKLSLAALFALITPIGMAIGIGVLQQFNGNDKSTIIAIGTLDALSAGILVWVGLVEMWAADWMVGSHGHKAELAEADFLTVTLAGLGLVSGLVLMSVLGKWA